MGGWLGGEGTDHPGMEVDNLDRLQSESVGHGSEDPESIGGAEKGLAGPVRMRHHPENVAPGTEDAGYVFKGAVCVPLGVGGAFGIGIAEGDAALSIQGCQSIRVTEVIAFHVADGHADDLPGAKGMGEGGIGCFAAKVKLLTEVALMRVAHEGTGQKSRFAEDLETIADAEHQAAGVGEAADGSHDGGEGRNRTCAQVVAVGESAGNKDGVATFEVC